MQHRLNFRPLALPLAVILGSLLAACATQDDIQPVHARMNAGKLGLKEIGRAHV